VCYCVPGVVGVVGVLCGLLVVGVRFRFYLVYNYDALLGSPFSASGCWCYLRPQISICSVCTKNLLQVRIWKLRLGG
jgi:hypothetical protein